VSDYRVSAAGRAEADRVRRQRREAFTHAALGGVLPRLVQASMTEAQHRAISTPLAQLRSALDEEQYAAAAGAAKDLVEAACHVTIDRSGASVQGRPPLPTLFTEAVSASGLDADGDDLGRSLTATVQRLAEFRNAAGAGHGRAAQPTVERRHGLLAASASCGIALNVLNPGQ
jgi:hypothetical protein